MTPDINLFDQPGFQADIPRKETEKVVELKKKKRLRKKKKRPAWDELIAALVLIGLGSLVVWYLSMKWTVKSEVQELTPEEFRLEAETGSPR